MCIIKIKRDIERVRINKEGRKEKEKYEGFFFFHVMLIFYFKK